MFFFCFRFKVKNRDFYVWCCWLFWGGSWFYFLFCSLVVGKLRQPEVTGAVEWRAEDGLRWSPVVGCLSSSVKSLLFFLVLLLLMLLFLLLLLLLSLLFAFQRWCFWLRRRPVLLQLQRCCDSRWRNCAREYRNWRHINDLWRIWKRKSYGSELRVFRVTCVYVFCLCLCWIFYGSIVT